MRWQTTVLLAVILLILGGFFYVYELRWAPEREKVAGEKGRVFAVDTKDVTLVELTRGGEVVRLVREGDGWQVTQPVTARGDRGAIEETLTTIATAKKDREITTAPGDPAEFGLDKPAAEVALTLKDGRRIGLVLGAKSPTGVWVYARQPDKPAVFVVAESVLRDTTRPVADFRDKVALAFDRTGVTGLEVVTRDDTLTVDGANERWMLIRPIPLPADTETITEFLEKLQRAKVKEFVAEGPRALEPFGLDRPVTVTVHTGKDKERVSRTLAFGRVDGAKQGVYAMRPGERSVFLLPTEVWQALPKTAAAIRNRTLVEVDREKLAGIEVQSPKGSITVAREEDRWRITAPEALAADQAMVGGLLLALRDLKAQAFLTDDASGIRRYLTRPEVRVTLTEKGAPAPTTILLAPSSETRGGRPAAYAAVEGRGPVVLVDAKALGDLSRSLTELRDRTLVSGLTPRDVKRVKLKGSGQELVLERSGDADWKVVEPSRGAARSLKVEELLLTLRGLKWKEIAAPEATEPGRYGLDAPLEVTLSGDGGKEIGTVLVGKREGERAFVRTKSAPAVYAVDAAQIEALPKTPDDLKG